MVINLKNHHNNGFIAKYLNISILTDIRSELYIELVFDVLLNYIL